MNRKVFFSYHHADLFRATKVRWNWITRDRGEASALLENPAWDAIKRKGDAEIRQWIDIQLKGTTITVVLIGEQTSTSKYVDYEVLRSYELGHSLLGVRINDMPNQIGKTSPPGNNPLDKFKGQIKSEKAFGPNQTVFLSQIYPTHDYTKEDGVTNLAQWIQVASMIPHI